MNISACLVTRGDVDMKPLLDSLPFDDVVVWDNSRREDLSVYGRYAAISEAKHDLIYVQDDDCIVSDPEAIAREWFDTYFASLDGIVANMSPHHQERYTDSCLVGFGACFHRDAPERAFLRFSKTCGYDFPFYRQSKWALQTCDVIFTTLTQRTIVDIPYADREFASDATRMWKQRGHFEDRAQMLELARFVRDREQVTA